MCLRSTGIVRWRNERHRVRYTHKDDVPNRPPHTPSTIERYYIIEKRTVLGDLARAPKPEALSRQWIHDIDFKSRIVLQILYGPGRR